MSTAIKMSAMANNTIEIECAVYDFKQKYAICLNVLKALKEKRLNGFTACVDAIKKGNCPALVMRKEEIAKGEAIYYATVSEEKKIEEDKPSKYIDKKSDSYRRGFGTLSSQKSPPKKKEKPQKSESKASEIAKLLISQRRK